MASKFQEQSHFEHNSPPPSVRGAGGIAGEGPSNGLDTSRPVSNDGSSVDDHVLEKPVAAVPLTKRQKVKRHCGRFKWWYLGVALVILIILLPLIFTKILPAITQSIVEHQKLPIIGGTFLALSPTTLSVTLETQLDTPLPADLDPTNLFVFNKDAPVYSPFINLTLPKQHVNHKTTVRVMNQTVTVLNQTELVRWFDHIFDDQVADISVKGKTTVHLGALHMPATIDKTIEVGALNYLKGFTITDLQLIVPPEENGNNIKGTLNLPNAGVLTLGLGNLTLDLYSGDFKLGYVNLYDVLLPPGNNSRAFDGKLNTADLLPNFGVILDSQSDALAEGNVRLRATGSSATINGVHIGYLEEVLGKKKLIADVPVFKLLGDVISGFTGGQAGGSLTNLFGDTFGNSTFIEGLLSHWNNTTPSGGSNTKSTKMARSPSRYESRTIKAPATKSLLKMGLKLALAKL
ncbi:hypothetical protein F5Y17DRAFT_203434 [Xylariaceae sp. FL0594]|nr:hypothetical protein F5Y17DRAFT_203434 [Xylariaceae sp. FL0594]